MVAMNIGTLSLPLLIGLVILTPIDTALRGTSGVVPTSDTTLSIQDLPDFLASAEPVVEIGALDSPEHEVFGDIVDAEFSPNGRLLILDSHHSSVRVFGADGSFVQELGRQGGGPGEFRRPGDMTFGPDGNLYVLDGQNKRVSVFRLTDGEYEFADSFTLGAGSQSICSLDGRLYSSAGYGRSFIQAYSLDGDKMADFGSVAGGNQLVRIGRSEGELACVNSASAVVLATSRTGRLYAFSAKGDSLWTGRLEGFRAQEITARPGGVSYSGGRDGIDVTRSIVSLAGETLIIQTEHYTSTGRYGSSSDDALKTYGVMSSNGLQVTLPDRLPWILARSGPRIAVKLVNPYPRVLVVDVRNR